MGVAEGRLTAAAVILSLLFGAGQLAKAASFPDTNVWASGSTANSLLLAVGIPSLMFAVYQSLALKRRLTANLDQRSLEELCQLIVLNFSAETGVCANDLAAHVWTIRRPWRTWRLGGRQEVLTRIATYKVSTVPRSGVAWTKGRGAVGLCWERAERGEAAFTVDLLPLHVVADQGRDAFNALDSDARLGISWQDFTKTRRYWALYVSPLREQSGNLIGVVSVDCTKQASYAAIDAAANAPAVTSPVLLMPRFVGH